MQWRKTQLRVPLLSPSLVSRMKRKIISWNCQGINAKKLNLQNIILETQPDIICLQEVQINPNDILPNFKGYQSYFNCKPTVTRAHGGTGLLIKPDIPQSAINITSGLQVTSVKVTIEHTISICSIYISEADWRSTNPIEIKNLIQNIPHPKIVTGDWNARNRLWHSDSNCYKGETLEKIFDELNMVVIDENSPTHISTAHNSCSHIDVTIVSPSLKIKTTWATLDDTFNSDHYPIILEIETENTPSYRRPRWNFKEANWTKYQAELNITIPQHIDNIPNLVNTVTEKIIAAAKNAIPLHKTFPKRLPVPWWNSSCKIAKEKRSNALKEYNRNMNVANAIIFKKEKANTVRTFNLAKRNSWMQYVSQLSGDFPIAKVWKRISRIQGKKSAPTIKIMTHNNQTFVTKPEIAEALAANFQEQQSTQSSTRNFTNRFRRENPPSFQASQGQKEIYNADFRLHELKDVLSKAGNTSMGLDNIHYQHLKQMSEPNMVELLEFYNTIWRKGEFPQEWKLATVIPILKKNKDPSKPTSYRPISLMSCLGKVFDKLIHKRLYWFMESNNFLPEEQSGFRKGRCTLDNLIILESDIRHAILNKQFLTAVFLDIEKAYDSCWNNTILKELKRFGLRGRLPCLIRSFLEERSFQVLLDDALSYTKETELGIPQGSSLSVTLFAIAIHTIKNSIPQQVKFLIYVDDIVIYHASNQIRTSERILQRTIDQIQVWSDISNFRISAEKSFVIKFTSNFHNQETPRLQISNVDIPVRERAKFLGMILDKPLKWGPHIKELIGKASRAMNLLRVVSNTKWGADTKTSLLLYKACIRPILDYGSILYSAAAKVHLSKVGIIQNQCLRLALGAMRTSPIESLQIETNIIDLKHRREYLFLRYAEKALNHPGHPVGKVLQNRYTEEVVRQYPGKIAPPANRLSYLKNEYLLQNVETKTATYTTHPPWFSAKPTVCSRRKKIDKDQPMAVLRQSFLEHSSSHNLLHIYTDGSSGPNHKGASCFFPSQLHLNKKLKLPWAVSIFTAEAIAIKCAVELVISFNMTSATIFTDSKSVLDAIESTCHPNDTIKKIVKSWNKAYSKGIEIHFCWSPGHVGIDGNEAADNLAKQATIDGEESNLPITLQEFSSLIKEKQKRNWQTKWDNLDTKLKKYKPSIATLTLLPTSSRRDEVIIRRLRLGHINATHSYLLENNGNTPKCEQCNSDLTVNHILYHCQQNPPSPFLNLTPCESDLKDELKVKKVLNYIRRTRTKV